MSKVEKINVEDTKINKDYWMFEFSELDCGNKYKNKVLTKEILQYLVDLDRKNHKTIRYIYENYSNKFNSFHDFLKDNGLSTELCGYNKTYLNHYIDGERREIIRIDINDGIKPNKKEFMYIADSMHITLDFDRKIELGLPEHLIIKEEVAKTEEESIENTNIDKCLISIKNKLENKLAMYKGEK